MKYFVIFPGGASPLLEINAGPYDLLIEAAKKYNCSFELMNYTGNGHYPKIGKGINIPEIIPNIYNHFTKICKYEHIIFCRCLGCHVLANLSFVYPDLFSNCRKVIIWAPPSNGYIWKLLSKTYSSIAEFNNCVAEKKGFKLSNDFLTNLPPLEFLLSESNFDNIILACGGKDSSCTKDYLLFLRNTIMQNRGDGVNIDINIIENAGHVISLEDPCQVLKQYYELMFDDE